jgi:hypothetical protein
MAGILPNSRAVGLRGSTRVPRGVGSHTIARMRRLLVLLAAAAVLIAAAPATGKTRLERFSTPSKRILCAYVSGDETLIRCDLLFLNDRAAVLNAGKRARLVKVSDVIGDIHARVLRYGTTRAFGRFTCTSRTTGLSCRDRRSGHGFEVSRERQRLF